MSPRLDIVVQKNNIQKAEDEEIDIESKQYNDLLKIYEIAMNQVKDSIILIKEKLNKLYGYTIIEKVSSRMKSNKSILDKIKRRGYDNSYKSLVDNINDLAGVRIVCPVREDVIFVKQIIEKFPSLKIVREKDYIRNPKKSGYSAYHMIVETPLNINRETVIIKVEIQIRTVAMDFWSEMEHSIRYKAKREMTVFDSKKLTWYAKILEKLQYKMIKLYRKQENDSMYYKY